MATYRRQILAYPFKVSLLVFFASTTAYVLGAVQLRVFAHVSWEATIITLICGTTLGLVWGVVEYFVLEHHLRPLTALPALASSARLPQGEQLAVERVSLRVKIFACSITLVIASLSFFAVAAYTRAANVLEKEIGGGMARRMGELATLIGALPRPDNGGLSVSWRWLAAEFPISPRGYLHIVDPAGEILATHPAMAESRLGNLRGERLATAVRTQILTTPEGYTIDRVDRNRIVAFAPIPGTRWKLVAIAPRRDFSPQLDQLLYTGLAGMALALLVAAGIGFLCARSITTPLAEVTRTARLVAEKHDLSQRIPFVTNDEVGVLAHAFNHMAEGLQTYSDGLERLVAERTHALERQTEQLAIKNDELSDFVYVASHDLRSPLINLAGFSRALRESVTTLDQLMSPEPPSNGNGGSANGAHSQWPQLKGEIDESLEFILRSVAKMDGLVNGLLELSRIETRQQVAQAVDTAKLVDDVLGAFAFQIAEKKIEVTTGRLPVVVGDPVRLGQVFSNLIDNAIKYMPPHAAAGIEVGSAAEADADRFFVRDTGPGIKPEDQDKVFRLFMRLGGNGVPGDGVGLATVRKIIEKHGGRIWVESEMGKGTTFWFTVPRRQPAHEALAQSA